jgi:hypothetical protein
VGGSPAAHPAHSAGCRRGLAARRTRVRVSSSGAVLWPRWWWVLGLLGVLLSIWLLVLNWPDARFATIPNAIVLAVSLFGFLAGGPYSLKAAYDTDRARVLVPLATPPLIDEIDIAHLPDPVQRYVRVTGFVGHPRIESVTARMHGRIRSGPDASWIRLDAEQTNTFRERSRLFYFTGSMHFVPVQGYHRFVGPDARMTVKAAALVPVAVATGPELARSETVTMFNDMCVLAPGTLIDRAIVWEPVNSRLCRARFTNAGHTIRAELEFNDAGELVNFWSDDRAETSSNGGAMVAKRWSTPLGPYRSFGPVRLASAGEARWHDPNGSDAYIELSFDDVQFNGAAPIGASPTRRDERDVLNAVKRP